MSRSRDVAQMLGKTDAASGGSNAAIKGFPSGWSASVDGNDMVFIYNSVEVFKVSTAGAITAKDNVTGYGTP